MAIQSAISVLLDILGDGVTTDFMFDLSKDVYSIIGPSSGSVQNWFTKTESFQRQLEFRRSPQFLHLW